MRRGVNKLCKISKGFNICAWEGFGVYSKTLIKAVTEIKGQKSFIKFWVKRNKIETVYGKILNCSKLERNKMKIERNMKQI